MNTFPQLLRIVGWLEAHGKVNQPVDGARSSNLVDTAAKPEEELVSEEQFHS